MLLVARWCRKDGLLFCQRATGTPIWEYLSDIPLRSAARSRSIGPHAGRSETQGVACLNLSEWTNIGGLDKTNSDFLLDLTSPLLRLNNGDKRRWMHSGLANWDVPQQTGLAGAGAGEPLSSRSLRNKFDYLCRKGHLEEALDVLVLLEQQGTSPSVSMYKCLLKAGGKRKALSQSGLLHTHFVQRGLQSTKIFSEYMVSTLVKCGDLDYALDVFHKLPERTVFSWTAVISGLALSGQGKEALIMYQRMKDEGVQPDLYTFVSLVKACGRIGDLKEGRRIHAEASEYKFDSDLILRTCLVDMYGKCRSIGDAQSVFDGLPQRDVVLWTALLMAYAQQGKPEKALELYEKMQEDNISPNDRTFVIALQACGMLAEKEQEFVVDGQSTKVQSLKKVRSIHDEARKKGCHLYLFVGNTLVNTYGKCGSIVDARDVFDGLSQVDVVSWNVILAAYSQHGQPEEAFQLYEQMRDRGVSPNDRTFVGVLQACSMLAEKEQEVVVDGSFMKVKSLERGKIIQANAQSKGYGSDLFFCSTLVGLYGKCGSIVEARNLFDSLLERSVVSWNVMLAAYLAQGQPAKALQLYEEMLEKGVSLNDRTFVSTLQACGVLGEQEHVMCGLSNKEKYLEKGKAIYAHAQMKGYNSDIFVGNTLVSTYAECGSITDAQSLFDGLSHRDVVSWTVMIAAYTQVGYPEKALQLYEQMWVEGVSPNDRTSVSILQACGMLAEKEQGVILGGISTRVQSLETGKAMHANALRKGYVSDVFVGNSLVSMYGKCGSIEDAWNVFDRLSKRDVVSWNAMLAAYALQGHPVEALQLYDEMLEEDVSPNNSIFVSALLACGMLVSEEVTVDRQSSREKCLEKVKGIHADAMKYGCDLDVFVGSTLISIYGKCGSIEDALDVFNRLSRLDIVPWNALLAAYAEKGQADKSLLLYKQMLKAGVSPDVRTFVSTIQACSILADKEEEVAVDGRFIKRHSLEIGKAIHTYAKRKGYASDIFVGSTLMSFYGKCGNIMDARNVFDGLSDRDVASWNSMIAAYVEQGEGDKALQLYKQMQRESVSQDEITLLCTLKACSQTGSLDVCRLIHRSLVSIGIGLGSVLAATLIHAYGRCSSMVDAHNVYDALPQPDLVSCNALIAGYAREGNCAASLQCYEEMQLAGIKPNGVTFLSLLSACSYAGLIDKGVEYFDAMSRDHGICPDIEHYVTMVDLLGRAGSFAMVEDVLSSMPMQPTLPLWLCLLGACRTHGKLELAEQAFASAVLLDPKHASAYVMMSNVYSDAGLFDRADEVKKLRQKECAWKEPGETWIDDAKKVHTFWVEDSKHSQHTELYKLLRQVGLKLQKEMYIGRVL